MATIDELTTRVEALEKAMADLHSQYTPPKPRPKPGPKPKATPKD